MNDKKKSSPVSFRLPANLKEDLAGRAAEFGLSPGEFARKVVIESLQNDFPTKVLAELARILRTTQAVPACALLGHRVQPVARLKTLQGWNK